MMLLKPAASQLAKLPTKTAVPQLHNVMTNLSKLCLRDNFHLRNPLSATKAAKKRLKDEVPHTRSCSRQPRQSWGILLSRPPSIKQTLFLWWATTARQFAYLQQMHKDLFTSSPSPFQIN